MRKYLGILVFLMGFITVYGQQPGQYSTYMLDPFRFNPGYAGLDHALSATATIRSQWNGLEGSPQGQRLSVHMPLYFLSGGVGIQLERDQIGAHQLTLIQGAYNLQKYVGNGILSLGASAAFHQWEFDGAKLRTPEGIYSQGVFSHEDVLLSGVSDQGQTLSFSAGLFYQNEKFEAGLSIDHLTTPSISLTNMNYQLIQVYYGYLATKFELGNSLLLKPSTWVRSDAIETQMDISLLIQYNDNIFTGASFRGYSNESRDALAVLFGFNLSENLLLAYSYDLALSTLNDLHSGSHELTVKYTINKTFGAGIPPRIIYHPRAQ